MGGPCTAFHCGIGLEIHSGERLAQHYVQLCPAFSPFPHYLQLEVSVGSVTQYVALPDRLQSFCFPSFFFLLFSTPEQPRSANRPTDSRYLRYSQLRRCALLLMPPQPPMATPRAPMAPAMAPTPVCHTLLRRPLWSSRVSWPRS